VWMPDSAPPGERLAVKVKDYCMYAANTKVTIANMSLHGCTFKVLRAFLDEKLHSRIVSGFTVWLGLKPAHACDLYHASRIRNNHYLFLLFHFVRRQNLLVPLG
jgi:hypothetical protein